MTEEDKGNHKVPGEEVEATEDEVIEESLLQDNDEAYCNVQQTAYEELDLGTEAEASDRENLLLMEDQEDKEEMETSALSNTEVYATPEPKLQVLNLASRAVSGDNSVESF